LFAVNDIMASLMRGTPRNGSDIKEVLRLEVASQLLKSPFTQSDREYMMKEVLIMFLWHVEERLDTRECILGKT
jgi:hypothetical protein